MKLAVLLLLPLAVVVLLSLPLFAAAKRFKNGQKAKSAIITNVCSFFAVLALAVILPIGTMAGAASPDPAANEALSTGLRYLAAALVTGLSCIGCGIAVAAAAPAAIGATAEEPKSFAKSLIFVALGEGVAIYGVLISILILFL